MELATKVVQNLFLNVLLSSKLKYNDALDICEINERGKFLQKEELKILYCENIFI